MYSFLFICISRNCAYICKLTLADFAQIRHSVVFTLMVAYTGSALAAEK